jgi:hypothetical protein
LLEGRFARSSTARFQVRTGLLVFGLPLDVRGFRTVLAHGWHGGGKTIKIATSSRPALTDARM